MFLVEEHHSKSLCIAVPVNSAGGGGKTSGQAALSTAFKRRGLKKKKKKPSKVFSNFGLKGNFLVNYIINAPYITVAHCYSRMPGYISN